MAVQGRIVIIDDEIEFIKTVDQFFTARGFEVFSSVTAASGLELVEAHRPGVVITDLKLPGMDGDEILRIVRGKHPEIQVIVITAYNDGGKTRERLLGMGAYAFFDKPLSSLRELSETVRAALGNASS